MSFIEYLPFGDWFNSLPGKELQLKGFETFNCTSFNTLAQVECYFKQVYGVNVNFSDRWLGIVAGTTSRGNDPQKVYEAIRKYGLIPDEMLPFSDDITSLADYYSFKGADKDACYREGEKWLKLWDFQHEWVVTEGLTEEEKEKNMRVALKSSPLCIGVYAWYADQRGVYVKMADENHWTFAYALDDITGFKKVDDSYDPTFKNVDQVGDFCKRIYIGKRAVVPLKKKPWIIVLIEYLLSKVKLKK